MVPVLRWILAGAATAMALAAGYGEFLIGISLMIGLLSRVASLFGCALMPAMWLSGGYPGPHAAFWMYWGASLNWPDSANRGVGAFLPTDFCCVARDEVVAFDFMTGKCLGPVAQLPRLNGQALAFYPC